MTTLTRIASRLAEAQNWRCCYCGFVMLSRLTSPGEYGALIARGGRRAARRRAGMMRAVTCDHIVSRSEGGTDAADNLVAACRWCNEFRGNRPADEAHERIQRLLRRGTHPHQVWAAEQHWPRHVFLSQVSGPASQASVPEFAGAA